MCDFKKYKCPGCGDVLTKEDRVTVWAEPAGVRFENGCPSCLAELPSEAWIEIKGGD